MGFTGIHHLTIDEQGRVKLPSVCFESGAFSCGESVVLAGLGDCWEITTSTAWEERKQQLSLPVVGIDDLGL